MEEAAQRIIAVTAAHWESNMGARPQEPKLVTLDAWAEAMFGDAKPHPNTLRNWRKAGRISPLPIKMGTRYFVEPTAIYVDDSGDSERLRHGS